MGYDTTRKLMKELNYEHFNQHELIFKLGDIGTKFYIILSGSVNILVPKKGLERSADERESLFLTDDNVMRKNDKSIVAIDSQDGIDPFLKVNFPNLLPIKILMVGSFFGEVALRQNIARTATIVAKEDCHLATLSRDAFNQIISKYYDTILENDLEFLKMVPFFSQYSLGSLEQILYLLKKETLPINHIIYKEGDSSDFLYFIKSGAIEISANISISLVEKQKHKRSMSNLLMSSVKNHQKNQDRIVVITLNKLENFTTGNYFGHDEIIENTKRTSMAKVHSSECILYSIKSDVMSFKKDVL